MSFRKFSITKTYPVFSGRNFRLYFYGQLISFAGNWLQNVAQGWLVLELTHSAFWVGFVYALPYLMAVILSPLVGIIGDKFNRRIILYWTQILGMAQALLLGFLVLNGHVTLGSIIILAFTLGFINSLDVSVRLAFISDIVEPAHVSSGLAIATAMQTASQVIGPALAGILIAFFGTGWTFIINGLTFGPVFILLIIMKNIHPQVSPAEHSWQMLTSGIRYIFRQDKILLNIILSGIVFMFGYSFRAVLPVITVDIFRAGPQILGWLGSAAGTGACLGAVIISTRSKEKIYLSRYVISGTILTSLALILFSFNRNLIIGLLLLFLAGLGFTIAYTLARAEPYALAEKEMRGRVSSVSIMIISLGIACGNYLAGWLTDKLGIIITLRLNGLTLLLIAAIIYVAIPRLYARPEISASGLENI